MDEIEPRKIRVPNSTFDVQEQNNGTVLVLRHGVPMGRMRIEQQQWAGYMLGGKEQKVCQMLDYNDSLWELCMKIQIARLKEQLKNIQHEK